MINLKATPPGTLPAPEPGDEIAPPKTGPIIWDTFNGINTQASRPGIMDDQCFWIRGFMPIGKNNLRTLPDVGTPILTGQGGKIVCFAFANIGVASVCIVFLNNGSILQVNVQTLAVTTIAAAGTITTPTQQNVGISQWGNQFIVIASNQANGYFIWDGTNFYQSGNIGALVNVENSGLNYSFQPTFILETTGAGTGTAFSAILNNDVIEQINVTNPGSGFGINDFVNLIIQGGGSDNTARATATIGPGGGLLAVAVLEGGMNYDLSTTGTVTGGGGTGAEVIINLVGQGGHAIVQSVTVLNPGQGYTSAPTITLSGQGGGTGAVFAASIFLGQISAITVTDPGTGYKGNPPTLNLIGDGTGGSFVVQTNSAGHVTGVQVINGGQGYTKALCQFTGGNNAAQGVVTIMPYGIQGTAAETYQSRVWVANQNKLSFTAADSLQDFATSDGGGTIESTDSFLRNLYVALKQTNGFLYIIADSSENYISNVQTTGSPPSTTFNNQNADPEVGSSWPYTVQVFNRNILFANSFGVHVSYGGAVTKISDNLDGVYNTVPNFGGFVASAAKAIIYGKKIWMVLLPIIDPVNGVQTNQLLMWDGKLWFASVQGQPLGFVASLELNSVLTAYGSDGSSIWPLFQKPSTAFSKVVQSKLWDKPGGYEFIKTSSRIWGVLQFNQTAGTFISISVDSERTASSSAISVPTPAAQWVNSLAVIAQWQNASASIVPWVTIQTGTYIIPPTAVGQEGALVGLTLTTDCADMTLVSLAVQADVWEYRG